MDGEIEIPEKSVFKVEEVGKLTGVKPYILRYWASEFEEIAPIISASGQKLYERRHIEVIVLIKKFLFEDKLTIAKAKLELLRVLSSASDHFESSPEVVVEQEEVPSPEKKDNFDQGYLLDDKGWQKLILAKAKLNSIVSFSKSVQEAHHWQ